MIKESDIYVTTDTVTLLFSSFENISGGLENLLSRQATGSVERVPQLGITLTFFISDGSGHIHVVGLLEDNLLDVGAAIRLDLQHHHSLHDVSGGLGRLHLPLLGFTKLRQKYHNWIKIVVTHGFRDFQLKGTHSKLG